MRRGWTCYGFALLAFVVVAGCGRIVTISPKQVFSRNSPDWEVRGTPGQSPPVSRAPAPLMLPQGKNQRLAVLEFQGKNLESDILMTFADTVRGGILQAVGSRGISVMTRENMLVLLKDMGKQDCAEGECEVETARNIGADYVVSGKVVRMERIYFITLKLHETKLGSLRGTDTIEGASPVELLHLLREHGRKLATNVFGAPAAAPDR
jgi:hypothetical protein